MPSRTAEALNHSPETSYDYQDDESARNKPPERGTDDTRSERDAADYDRRREPEAGALERQAEKYREDLAAGKEPEQALQDFVENVGGKWEDLTDRERAMVAARAQEGDLDNVSAMLGLPEEPVERGVSDQPVSDNTATQYETNYARTEGTGYPENVEQAKANMEYYLDRSNWDTGADEKIAMGNNWLGLESNEVVTMMSIMEAYREQVHGLNPYELNENLSASDRAELARHIAERMSDYSRNPIQPEVEQSDYITQQKIASIAKDIQLYGEVSNNSLFAMQGILERAHEKYTDWTPEAKGPTYDPDKQAAVYTPEGLIEQRAAQRQEQYEKEKADYDREQAEKMSIGMYLMLYIMSVISGMFSGRHGEGMIREAQKELGKTGVRGAAYVPEGEEREQTMDRAMGDAMSMASSQPMNYDSDGKIGRREGPQAVEGYRPGNFIEADEAVMNDVRNSVGHASMNQERYDDKVRSTQIEALTEKYMNDPTFRDETEQWLRQNNNTIARAMNGGDRFYTDGNLGKDKDGSVMEKMLDAANSDNQIAKENALMQMQMNVVNHGFDRTASDASQLNERMLQEQYDQEQARKEARAIMEAALNLDHIMNLAPTPEHLKER